MKTARSAPPAHGSPHQYRAPKSSTPLASPRMLVHSVGQPYPPKISPRHSPRAASVPRQPPGAAQETRTSSSPSYFGLVVEPNADQRDSAAAPRDNWSPPSSSVRSFAAAIPKQFLPLDANPAYDAFRRQADANHFGRSFALGSAQFETGRTPIGSPQVESSTNAASSPLARPQPSRRPTQDNGPTSNPSVAAASVSGQVSFSEPSWPQHGHDATRPTSSQMDVDAEVSSLHDSAYVSSDSKRNSEASIDPSFFPNVPRFESPAQLEPAPGSRPSMPHLHSDEYRHPRFPMALGRLSMTAARPSTLGVGHAPPRAETAPAKIDSAQSMMDVKQLKEIMDLNAAATSNGLPAKLLLLDVRVATYYATSRIRGALNLCIPTTLLKRATYNLQKLQLTFATDADQAKFSCWRDASYLVVYDNSSAEKRDAIAATNMLRKFTNEGYQGQACILRGGFKAFEEAYPDLVDRQASAPAPSGSSALSLSSAGARRLSIAPIIGGVMLPSGSSNPNPFFSNIRQNMDLADGVGRIELALPQGVTVASLPAWLREAADPSDRGQKVSEKFLKLELAEQARMKNAYEAFNPSVQCADPSAKVQLCGVEKGSKNRYKDILPFEHARVRLQGRRADDCDYVNASHLRASRSNKRYIASQAPLPATFSDFWSMIWDEDVRVIVMLTAESEGGQLKCHPYWKNKEYGAVKLHLISEKKVSLDVDKYRSNSSISGSVASARSSDNVPAAAEFGRRRAHTLVPVEGSDSSSSSTTPLHGLPHTNSSEIPFVFIRKFALSHGTHPFSPIREVTQLHYASWPDFGTPAQPSHLLALVELANAMQRAASPLDGPKAAARTTSFPTSQASAGAGSGKLDHLFWPWHDEPEFNPDPKPMLVHCSAGCGRTGTFCTVDSVLDMLKRQNQRSVRQANDAANNLHRQGGGGGGRRQSNIAPDDTLADNDVVMADAEGPVQGDAFSQSGGRTSDVDGGFDPAWLDGDSVDLVARTVEDFRTQRLSMVQTLRQYVLCYETVTEWVAKMQERRGGSARAPGRARSESMRMTTA